MSMLFCSVTGHNEEKYGDFFPKKNCQNSKKVVKMHIRTPTQAQSFGSVHF